MAASSLLDLHDHFMLIRSVGKPAEGQPGGCLGIKGPTSRTTGSTLEQPPERFAACVSYPTPTSIRQLCLNVLRQIYDPISSSKTVKRLFQALAVAHRRGGERKIFSILAIAYVQVWSTIRSSAANAAGPRRACAAR